MAEAAEQRVSITEQGCLDTIARILIQEGAKRFGDLQNVVLVSKLADDPTTTHLAFPYLTPATPDASLSVYPYTHKLNVFANNNLPNPTYMTVGDDRYAYANPNSIGRADFNPHVLVQFGFTPTSRIDHNTYDARMPDVRSDTTCRQEVYTGGDPEMHVLLWGEHAKALKEYLQQNGCEMDADRMGAVQHTYNELYRVSPEYTKVYWRVDPGHPEEAIKILHRVIDALFALRLLESPQRDIKNWPAYRPISNNTLPLGNRALRIHR